MPSAWFVRASGKVFGPLDEQRLVKLAAEGKINANTDIAQNQNGPWCAAGKVKGLKFATAQPKPAAAAAQKAPPFPEPPPPVHAEARRPVSSAHSGMRLSRRLVGIGIALASALILVVVFVAIPGGVRFPVIILAVPAVAIAAGLFQAITGLTLFEVNEDLPNMPLGKQVVLATTALVLLILVLCGFVWFVMSGHV